MYNMPLLHRQMLDVLGIKNANKLIPMDEDQKPTDPVSENQNILMMKPVKAFIAQDHQAHIAVHMSAMQDPKIIALLQNNPMAPQLQAAMMAHVNEHLGFEYRKQIEQQLGMSLPPQKDESGEDMPMDPQVEARLSPLLAQAATQLLQQNQAQAAQQQAQQQAQDPLVQMQQQELQLKGGELERKKATDQVDAQLKQAQLQLENKRIDQQGKTEGIRIGAKSSYDLKKLDATQTAEGIRIGADLSKQDKQLQVQMAQARENRQYQSVQTEQQRNQPKPTKGK
jgi:hypothetical protein